NCSTSRAKRDEGNRFGGFLHPSFLLPSLARFWLQGQPQLLFSMFLSAIVNVVAGAKSLMVAAPYFTAVSTEPENLPSEQKSCRVLTPTCVGTLPVPLRGTPLQKVN